MSRLKKIDGFYYFIYILRFLLICYVIAACISALIVRKEVVVGTSMYPTLKDKQTVLVNVANAYLTPVKRFDVVVVKNGDSDNYWVKRVIGLPNEKISYKNDQLYINGKKIQEKFLNDAYKKSEIKRLNCVNFSRNTNEIVLKDDEYFLVGDNRPSSLDSRDVGPFKREQIIANGAVIIFPLNSFQVVK